MGISSITLVKDRLERFASLPDLGPVGITSVTVERDHVSASTCLVMTAAKGTIRLTINELDPKADDNVAAVVCGVPQDAPNPAKRKGDFLDWLKTHPQLVDPPLDATKLARAAWVDKYGTVPQCYLCGHPMRSVTTKDGNTFWGCSTWRDTECKGSLNVDEDGLIQPRCPDCGKPMRLRDGARGEFWGCTGYSDGCRRTLDGPVGKGLRTEVEDWLPSPGGGVPATAKRPRPEPAKAPPAPPADSATAALASRVTPPATPAPEAGPSPGGSPSARSAPADDDRSTSLAALRRRFKGG